MMEITRSHVIQCPGCMVNASSLQYYRAQVTLAQERPYAVEHYLDEKSIEKVLVISAKYDQRVFPVPSCNTPYNFQSSSRIDFTKIHFRRMPIPLKINFTELIAPKDNFTEYPYERKLIFRIYIAESILPKGSFTFELATYSCQHFSYLVSPTNVVDRMFVTIFVVLDLHSWFVSDMYKTKMTAALSHKF